MNASSQATPVEVPPTFDTMPLSSEVRHAVDELGFVTPTPVQTATFEPAAAGRDLIVQARTGTGKTLAFGLPLIDRTVVAGGGTQVLVLTPTRELALQVGGELARVGKHKNLRVSAVYGGAPIERQVAELSAGTEIVTGTPGRVLDHLRRGTFVPERIRALVLDEADEMFSMGFAKEMNAILELLPTKRQTMCFSATVDDDVKRLASRHMREPEFITLSSDTVGAQSISHFVYFVSGKDRVGDLVRILEVEDPESAIIFCNTKVETERVAAELQQRGFSADWLNGDLPQGEREKVLGRTRAGQLRYLVATDVAARGIDISHVTHVIHYSFPEAAEQYVHRSGRTGRAGRTGTAIALVSAQEIGALYYLRLQFKISPIERSIPNAGEMRTRQEADRIGLLAEAVTTNPSELDRSVARRLLTHPEAERLVAGLLGVFFGSRQADADVEAAAARRSRTRTAEPPPEPRRVSARAEGPRDDADRGRQRRPPRHEARDSETSREREPIPSLRTNTEDAVTIVREPKPPRARRERDDDEAVTTPRAQAARPDSPEGSDSDATSEDPSMTVLYVNLGRRDGVRAGDLARLVRERGGVAREQVGRIRIREKHAFVCVTKERAQEVVTALSGTMYNDKALVAEPAKASRS